MLPKPPTKNPKKPMTVGTDTIMMVEGYLFAATETGSISDYSSSGHFEMKQSCVAGQEIKRGAERDSHTSTIYLHPE